MKALLFALALSLAMPALGDDEPPQSTAPKAPAAAKTKSPAKKAPAKKKAGTKSAAKQKPKPAPKPAPKAAGDDDDGDAPATAKTDAKDGQPAATTEVKDAPKAAAAEQPANAIDNMNFRLIEVFNVEQLPGTGTLTYKSGDKVEEIKLGADMGLYALGMIFEGSNFPEQYAKDFRNTQVIQIAMGTMRSRLQGQVPQFGVVSLITKKIPASKAKFPFFAPTGNNGPSPEEMAFLLFTSPTTPNERTDEEKLKGTYFSQSGTLTVTPKGPSRLLEVKSQGKRMTFKLRMMKMDFDASMVTPFNAQPSTIKGSIEFPVYAAKGKEAELVVQRMASDSLETTASQAMQEGLSTHPRGIAGSTARDVKPEK